MVNRVNHRMTKAYATPKKVKRSPVRPYIAYSSKCLLYKPNQFFTANNKSLRQKWLLKQRQFAQYCVMTEEFYRFGEEKRRKKEKKKKKKETKEEIYLFY